MGAAISCAVQQVLAILGYADVYLYHLFTGHLEKASTPPPPPPPAPTPAAEFSWGGPRLTQSAQSLTSLRDIQNQEAAFTGEQHNAAHAQFNVLVQRKTQVARSYFQNA